VPFIDVRRTWCAIDAQVAAGGEPIDGVIGVSRHNDSVNFDL